MKGKLFVVSGPSGVGKTVLCGYVVDKYPGKVVYSISTTSRAPRGGETDGQEYNFCSADEFKQAIDRNEFAEWAFVHGNYYGTRKSFLESELKKGRHVILNIDVQGAMKIHNVYPEAIMVFVAPPSYEELEHRIRARNMDSEESLRKRMENARKEMEYKSKYNYTIVNDSLSDAQTNIEKIFVKHMKEN